MKLLCSSLLLLLLNVANYNSVEAIELQPRKAADCAFLTNKIYCYGGYISGYDGNDTISSLDIYQNKGGPVQNLNSQWAPVTPNNPSNVVIGRRAFAQTAALPDGDRFLIQGGYNYNNSTNPEQNIAYNAKTNSWEVLPSYYEASNGGNRQIYYGVASYVPSLSSVAFYGGYQEHVASGSNYVTPDGKGYGGLTFNNSDGYINSYAGFYYLTLFNLNTNKWSIPSQYPVPYDSHINPSAVLSTLSNKIYYIGGSYYNVTSATIYNSYLNYAMTYNTVSGQWLYETIGGTTPSVRKMHSTTMLANGQDVLLYGGTEDGTTVVMDYCYTLNLPSMTWTYHNLVAPVGTSGPRSHHSAVLVNQTSLFILFGISKDSSYTNDLLILDVRDVNNLNFVTNFPFDNDGKSSNSNSNNNSNSTSTNSSLDKGGLGTGAIAGIAVGGVAAVAFLILAFICLSRRKKNKKNSRPVSSSSANYEQHKNHNENEILEVDWDKIDNQYKEINLPRQSFNQQYDSEHQQVEEIYSASGQNTGNSLTSSPTYVNASSTTPDPRANTISPDYHSSSEFKPNSPGISSNSGVARTTTTPDVALPPTIMNVVKPDGGGK